MKSIIPIMIRGDRCKERSSRTAQYTCMCRASSYLEKDELYKSGDHISVRLLPGFIKFLLKNRILKLTGRYSPKGIYEYVIARTKYIDHIFIEAIDQGIDQILILGAGFDTRGIRLLLSNSNARVFELDTQAVLNGKTKQLNKRGINIPDNIIHIPVDFLKDDIRSKLSNSGYSVDIRTLFILEGLIMYLSPESVDQLFSAIQDISARGSMFLFDYVYGSVLRHENRYYGEREIYRTVEKADEKWKFGIDEGTIIQFLDVKGLKLIEELNSTTLEERYFKNSKGEIIARVNGTHSLVLTEKVSAS